MEEYLRYELRIQLLGGFAVSVGSCAIPEGDWRSRKAKTLVKLLVLAPSHRLHREQLMETLWPDLDPQAAANNLRKALHIARRVLDPSQAETTNYLHLDGDLLSLRSDRAITIDVEEFEATANSARRSQDPALYRAAIALYAGDLLPEDRYEEWSIARREELRTTYISLLAGLAQLYESRGELEQAIEMLRLIATTDPLHEEAHAGLMRLYVMSGQRHQALRQYDQLREGLRHELDSEPTDATQRLYGEIKSGSFPQSPPATDHQPPTHVRPIHNLPAQLTTFIGREKEIAEVKRLLSANRLLTLTGPGGCGKTRLALEVAASLIGRTPEPIPHSALRTPHFKDGVWLVELAALSDPALVPQVVASLLSVREEPDRALTETIANALSAKNLLLILDNCEHLIEACANLADRLLRAAPNLRILATSREALNIPGEVAWLVPSLSLPQAWHVPPVESLARYEAIQLFVERAANVLHSFSLVEHNAHAIEQICQRLDGIPLAIELAAALVKVLPVEQIASRLDHSFHLLTRGSRTSLPRHQTLRAAMEWSYNLLSEDERALFRRLSVFAGGFTLEAAEAVYGDPGSVLEVLSCLVDKSLVLVVKESSGEARYRLLGTLRQYGQERLMESNDADEAERRHAEYYLALAERAEPELRGREQVAWLERVEREHDNLRAALDWSLRHDPEMGLRIAWGFWWYWDVRGYHSEGRRWLADLLAMAPARTVVRARALNCAGALAGRQGDAAAALPLMTESLGIFREVGDRLGEAGALERLGLLRYFQGDSAGSQQLLQEGLALCRALDYKPGVGWTYSALGMVARIEGNYEQARASLEEALSCLRGCGDLRGIAYVLNNLGQLMRAQGEYARAEALLAEGLAVAREVGDKPFTGWALLCMGDVARRQGNMAGALARLTEGLMVLRDIGHRRHLSRGLYVSGVLAAQQGDYARAVRLIGAAVAVHDRVRSSLDTDELADWETSLNAARAALTEEDFDRAWSEGKAMTREQAVEYALG